LRGCEEGVIPGAEQLLQLFSSRTIEPQTFQFRITPLIQDMAERCVALRAWKDAIHNAVREGAVYSELRPLTNTDEANSIGRKCHGPIVVLVDALSYSSAEALAAGFQDHGIAPVIGTAPRTGGGGASAWNQDLLYQMSGNALFRRVDNMPSFRVATRRSRRG